MNPIQLLDPASSTYTYVLFDPGSAEAIIIDPVDTQVERDLQVLRDHKLKLLLTIETHRHADHLSGAVRLAELTGAKTTAPAACQITTAHGQLHDGDFLNFGDEQLMALHTPGHSPGSMCFLWRNHVFTGDTLHVNGCGRTDFLNSDTTDLYHSVTEILFKLPENTVVWPGHDYHGQTHSTIGTEKASNALFSGKSLEEFLPIVNTSVRSLHARGTDTDATDMHAGVRKDTALAHAIVRRSAEGYAGDICASLAWEWLQTGKAVLVDVRTDAERDWVGVVPGAQAVAWKQWPGMALNPNFDDDLLAAVPEGKKVMFLCRSGVRSVAAAKQATELGLQAFNILEGFEGDADSNGQRGHRNGWRFHGLPWRQS